MTRILLSLLGLAWAALSVASPPNIVLINADDLGFGDMGVYGHPVLATPRLDRLAAEGLRFTQFYAPSALCSPSRAALLTGRMPYRTGIRSWIPAGTGVYLRAHEVTLAEVLKAVGYRTALIGKWHLNSDLGSPDEPQPNDQGFDYFYGHNAFQIPTNKDPTNIFRNREKLERQVGFTAALYADEASQWLATNAGKAPFFLYLAMAEPHTTIENPPAMNALYAEHTSGDIVPIPSGEAEIPFDKLTVRGPGEYYANITFMDQQIGRVLDTLDELGHREDTIVVFTSDNGPVTQAWHQWFEVNAYGNTAGLRGRKHYLYEGGIRVPTIIRYPALIKAGSTTDEPVIATDLFTTLSSIAGAEVPSDRIIDGRDIQAVLAGESLEERVLFWALDSVGPLVFAVRADDWKLLLDREMRPVELYHLTRDPLELVNVINQHASKVAELTQYAEEWLRSIDQDPLRPETPGSGEPHAQ